MLKIKKPMFAMLAFMVVLELIISLIFNLMSLTGVIPRTMRGYFIALSISAILFLFITGFVMRRFYRHLVYESMKQENKASEENKTTDDRTNSHDQKPYYKQYYFTTLIPCAIFMALVYIVRLFVGSMPFKWTCALTNFANFTGRVNNVYFSILIFGVLLFATVFVAKTGVKSNEKKQAQENAEQYSKYKNQRDAEAEQMTREFRENENEAEGVDLYDFERWDQYKQDLQENDADRERSEALRREKGEDVDVLGEVLNHQDPTETDEDIKKRSEELRREKREGVDVLGAVLDYQNQTEADEEIKRRSEELRREKREGVDVLGAVLDYSRSQDTDDELEKRSEELRREKREDVDVLGAVITNNLDPEEKY